MTTRDNGKRHLSVVPDLPDEPITHVALSGNPAEGFKAYGLTQAEYDEGGWCAGMVLPILDSATAND